LLIFVEKAKARERSSFRGSICKARARVSRQLAGIDFKATDNRENNPYSTDLRSYNIKCAHKSRTTEFSKCIGTHSKAIVQHLLAHISRRVLGMFF
jgi:hypothetical protein